MVTEAYRSKLVNVGRAPVARRIAMFITRGVVVCGFTAGLAWAAAGTAAARPNVDPPPCVGGDPFPRPSPMSQPPECSAGTVEPGVSLRVDLPGEGNCLSVGDEPPPVA